MNFAYNPPAIETSKLIDMLENDFGFSQNELHVYFSGHRGYHVHIENESVRSLDAMARKEIVDYVTGLGIAILDKDAKQTRGKRGAGAKKFSLHNFGWNRRLKVGMADFLLNATTENLKVVGLNNKAVLENKELIIKRAIQGRQMGKHQRCKNPNMAKTSRVRQGNTILKD